MKIVAHIPNRYGPQRALVEMTAEEIARLQGIPGYLGNSPSTPDVGFTFEVSKAWDLMVSHRAAASQLKEAAKTLHALGDLCAQQAPQLLAEPVEVKAP